MILRALAKRVNAATTSLLPATSLRMTSANGIFGRAFATSNGDNNNNNTGKDKETQQPAKQP
jgi:hypothetical protein